MTQHHVVVAYDFSEHADRALQTAITLASADPTPILHFVTVIEVGQSYQLAGEVQEDLLRRLRVILQAVAPGRDLVFNVHVLIGNPIDEILGVAADVGAELILCGSHGRGKLSRLLVGSVSEALVHGARCPVMVVREQGYAHVELEQVVETEPHGPRRPRPHRYSYSSAGALTRPDEWPLG